VKIFASARLCLIAVAMVVGVPGCYRGPTTEDPDLKIVRGSSVPYGVMTPWPGSSPDAGDRSGIYSSHDLEDPYCCWLAASARFRVRVPAMARQIIFVMFVPDLDVFRERKQEVDIFIDGRLSRQYTSLYPGLKLLDAPIPPHTRAGTVGVQLRAGFTFVPSRRKINKDGRRLSILLKQIVVR
jgi:hypothetical protein